MLIWILGVLFIPVITAGLLFVSLAEDFWQLLRFQLGFSRLFGDLFHVVIIVVFAFLAEVFCIVELLHHF